MKTITISFTDEAYRELCQSSQAYRFTKSISASVAVAIGIVDSIERGLPLHVFKTREERGAEAVQRADTGGVPVGRHGYPVEGT